MAASRRPPPNADDPNHGGGRANSSKAAQDSGDIDAYSPAASPPSALPSGQPGTSSILVNQESSDGRPTMGAASSSAQGPDEDGDPKIAGKTAFPFPLGPRVLSSPMVASDYDDDGESWLDFSDRTDCGASTSTSSPGTYDHRSSFEYWPSYEETRDQILEHYFWSRKGEARDDVSMVLRRSQNGGRKIHEKEPLSSLESEFLYKSLKDKANMLLANYSAYRKVDGDGSCFYRSFMYSYLEQLVEASPDEEMRLLSTLVPMLKKFQRLHWPDSYSDGHNAFTDLILECMGKRETLSVSEYQDWLFQDSQNEEKYSKILSYLRLVTAIEMCSEPAKFRDSITELDPVNPDLVGFCRRYVIPMNQEAEAEEFHEIALTDVLQVPLRTVIVDDSKTVEPNTHIIHPESPSLLVPSVTLLYRPGHYDILYK